MIVIQSATGNGDLSKKQDKTDERLFTESKDIVGAINEVYNMLQMQEETITNQEIDGLF